MATVSITVSGLTTVESRAVAIALDKINAARAAAGQAPFATAKLALEDHIVNNMLASWVKAEAEESLVSQAKALWPTTTDTGRTAAVAALSANQTT